jgi:hypothetical protein
MVRRTLRLGFSLAELAWIFRVREQGGAPYREVGVMEIERQLEELRQSRDY